MSSFSYGSIHKDYDILQNKYEELQIHSKELKQEHDNECVFCLKLVPGLVNKLLWQPIKTLPSPDDGTPSFILLKLNPEIYPHVYVAYRSCYQGNWIWKTNDNQIDVVHIEDCIGWMPLPE